MRHVWRIRSVGTLAPRVIYAGALREAGDASLSANHGASVLAQARSNTVAVIHRLKSWLSPE